MRHVVVMTSTGAVGLVSIFIVDVLNLFYISLLGQQELAAAVGYASTILFFSISFSIGFTIATTAVVARALGAENEPEAFANAGAALVYMGVMSVTLSAIMFPLLGPMLDLLGAKGETHAIALNFMQIVTPSVPLMALGMCFAALLRAKGDARRAMYVTLWAGVAAAVLDPILIFYMEWGVTGAAIATVLVRVVLMAVGLYGAVWVHDMVRMPSPAHLRALVRPYLAIAIPAAMTQIATPVGNAYVTGSIAAFGDDAVAGWAIVGRLYALAFAGVFALSGAVGPILSQNFGARKFDRVTRAMWDSLFFATGYTLIIWLALIAVNGQIIAAFGATADAADLVRFFCWFVAGTFLFQGAIFVANAAFNNLGFPMLSTVFNWGRATLGTFPFVFVGATWWGPNGVLLGWGLGGVIFGVAAVIVCFRVLRRLPEKADAALPPPPASPPTANSPFTSGRGATA